MHKKCVIDGTLKSKFRQIDTALRRRRRLGLLLLWMAQMMASRQCRRWWRLHNLDEVFENRSEIKKKTEICVYVVLMVQNHLYIYIRSLAPFVNKPIPWKIGFPDFYYCGVLEAKRWADIKSFYWEQTPCTAYNMIFFSLLNKKSYVFHLFRIWQCVCGAHKHDNASRNTTAIVIGIANTPFTRFIFHSNNE